MVRKETHEQRVLPVSLSRYTPQRLLYTWFGAVWFDVYQLHTFFILINNISKTPDNMGQEEVSAAPEVRHDDDITPYTAPIVPREHLDLDKEVYLCQ